MRSRGRKVQRYENAETRASTHLLRLIADSMPAYIAYVTAKDLRYQFVNARFEAGFDRPRADFVGRHIREIIGEANYTFARPYIEEVRAGRAASYENTFLLTQGRRWIRVNYVPDFDEDGTVAGIVVLSYDVTEQRAAQEALRAERDFAEGLIETARAAVLVLDLKGRIIRFNHFLEELSGKGLDDVKGEDWVTCFVPAEDQAQARGFLEAALAEASTPGHLVPVQSARGDIRRIEWYDRPLRDPVGGITGLLVIGHDVTERWRAEQARAHLETELLQAQKMDAIGKLAGGIAHDMNNILATMMGMASLLQHALPRGSEEAGQAAAIVSAAQRGADLTRNLLGFARKGSYQKAPLDLHEIVEQVERVLLRTLPKRVHLELSLRAERSVVLGDGTQLQQVVVNLVLNAVDAITERGTVTIRTSSFRATGDPSEPPGLSAGDHICLEVEDDGAGMDEDTQARAFEPFYTTKEAGRGTGLGLAMVYGTTRAHGGQVTLRSRPGIGTTVRVCLPTAEQEAPEERSPARTAPETGVSGRILVVDDEPLVRASTADMLRGLGHPVEVVESGKQALERLETSDPSIALVILDLVMPEMDGTEVFGLLRARWPRLPVVLCTGHGQDAVIQAITNRPDVALLRKPFTLAQLAEAIHAQLAR